MWRRATAAAALAIVAWIVAWAADSDWLKRVEPILRPEEKASYLRLSTEAERNAFAAAFWSSKRISADEYFRRVAYIDANFGSSRFLSGANTDRGRVYLSLGAPEKVTRLVSSRIFYPIEIWYYDSPPAVGIPNGLHLLFYQKNAAGEYKLYSPTLESIRALLNPQSSNKGMFRVNDAISAADIRTTLNLGPVENEVIDAAVGVAAGITGSGNEELIALVTSPRRALNPDGQPSVRSRFYPVMDRPKIRNFFSWSEDGTPIADLLVVMHARFSIGIRVSENGSVLDEMRTDLHGGEAQKVAYQQRFYLLPGNYLLTVITDGLETPWSLAVGPRQASSEILLGEASENATANATPFQFGPLRLTPSENGRLALIQVTRPQLLTWRLRRGPTTVWKSVQPASEIPSGMAVQEIGRAELAPGAYQLEVTGEDFSKTATVPIGETQSAAISISYNANLVADARFISLGKQYLQRRMMHEARRSFEQALALRDSDEARVNLARTSAREGDLEGARRRLNEVLDRTPDHFEALSSMGSIAAQMGDYSSAVRYYQRALAIQKSPILSKALSELMARMPQPTPR